jgi:Big-like domain-containing protein
MLLNERKMQMWKSEVRKIKMWFQGIGIAVLLAVFVAGCGGKSVPSPVTHVPALSAISPNSGTEGQSVSVTLTGTFFASGDTIGLSGTGITASNTAAVSSTQISATFVIAANAPGGAQSVSVTSPDGTSSAQTFTMNLLPPTVSSTNPAHGATTVPINRKITATFSKALDPATITTATFILTGTTTITGVVTYDATNKTAT